jgi:nicotinate-nucleotide pyrophosphorylase (carboxylating)
MDQVLLDGFILQALSEDIGEGDHTSIACVPENLFGSAKLLVKQTGILAGVEVAQTVFNLADDRLSCDVKIHDGSEIKHGDIVFHLHGPRRAILKSERLALNIMQRMSGIATLTSQYVKKIDGTKATILDTRKTTPNMRFLEKEAVRIGGGNNHRMGLYDMIMIKDNHIDYAGGIETAIQNTINYLKHINKNLQIEIEARDFDELVEILKIGGVHRIMLDNFSPDETRLAVKMIDGKYETESSGGINLNTIREYAEAGVDYISVGALTHQISSLDLSLKAF